MRRKLKNRGGLTLVELMCAVVVLGLLGLLINAGLQAAVKSYRTMVAQSEVQLLLSTAADALAGELRCARDPVVENGTLTYRRPASLESAVLELDGEGHIRAGGKHLLTPGWKDEAGKWVGGAYHGEAYRIERMDVSYDRSCFTISLKAAWTGGEDVSAETEFQIRCLNKPGETGEAEQP